jgi:hypothetical protein
MSNIDKKNRRKKNENVKPLTLDDIFKASDKYENVKEIQFDLEIDGELRHFSVEIYKYFSPIHVKQCIMEFISKMEHVKSVDKDGFGDIAYPYLMFLMVKHFTTLKLPEAFNEQVVVLKKMLETGVLFKIYLNFDENEIKKIHDELKFIIDNFDKNIDAVNKFKEELREQIQNKELLE